MPKQYKIKRYHKSTRSYRAKPHPVTVILLILVVGALLFVGASIYEPVKNFVLDTVSGRRPAVTLPEDEPDIQATQPPEQEEQQPAEPEAPPELRTVYLPLETAKTGLDAFLDALPADKINAVMVDIKDASGYVLFNTSNAKAAEWGAVVESPLDLKALAEALAAKGFHLVVRMPAFRDPLAARADYENAIRYLDSEWLWLDNYQEAGGQPWLNPYAKGVTDYVESLALEAVDAGAAVVMLENVQFPSGSGSNATFGETGGLNRQEVLAAFTAGLSAKLEERGARLAVYVTAISLTQEYENQARYGGSPLMVAGGVLVLGALPYQFGGDYAMEGMEIASPVENPGPAVEAMLAYLLDTATATGGRTIIPLLQGGPEPTVAATQHYSRVQVEAQISAVEARDLREYILYTTDGNYAF